MNRCLVRRVLVPATVTALLVGHVAPAVARADVDDPPGTVVVTSSNASGIALSPGRVSWTDDSSHTLSSTALRSSPSGAVTVGAPSQLANLALGPNLAASGLRTGYTAARSSADEQTYVVTDGTRSTTIHDAALVSRVVLSGTRVAYLSRSGRQQLVDLRTHRTTDMTATLGASRGHVALWGNYYAFSKPDGSVWRKDVSSPAPAVLVAPKTPAGTDPYTVEVFEWGDWVAYTQWTLTPVGYSTQSAVRNMSTMAAATNVGDVEDFVVGASAGGVELWSQALEEYQLLRWGDGSFAASLPISHDPDQSYPETQERPPAVDGSIVGWIGSDHRPRIAPLGIEVVNKPRALGVAVASSTMSTGGSWRIEVPTSAVLFSCAVNLELLGDPNPADITVGCDSGAMSQGEVVATWDGKQNDGHTAPPGYYFWTASAQGFDGPLFPADGGIDCVCDRLTVVAPSLFHPLTPSRLLDTRTHVGGSQLAGHGTLTLQVGGRGRVPSSGVAAVALSVTAVRPAAQGWLAAYPTGFPRPAASNLNFAAGQTVANLITAPLSTDGTLTLYNGSAGATDLVADVEGYYATTPSGTPGAFVSVNASRLLDTRAGLGSPTAATGHGTIALDVAGHGPVPATGISAVALNVTVTAPTTPGFLTVYGGGDRKPLHTLTFAAGQAAANLVVVPVSSDGQVDIYNGASGTAQILADVVGYYLAGTPIQFGAFVPTPATRLLDTGSSLGPRGTLTLPVAGHGPIPAAGAGAAFVNVTALGASADGFVAVYPGGTRRPLASDLFFSRGRAISSLVAASLGESGTLELYNGSTGTTRLLADVSGYFVA